MILWNFVLGGEYRDVEIEKGFLFSVKGSEELERERDIKGFKG